MVLYTLSLLLQKEFPLLRCVSQSTRFLYSATLPMRVDWHCYYFMPKGEELYYAFIK